jgi:hypothetical protein
MLLFSRVVQFIRSYLTLNLGHAQDISGILKVGEAQSV